MIRGLERLHYEERLRDLRLISLEKMRGGLLAVYKYLECCSQVDEARLFSVVCSNRIRSNGLKLEHKFHVNVQKNGALEQVAQWSCGGIQTCLDASVCNLL